MLSVNFIVFFFNDTATTEIYTLSLHDALPISRFRARQVDGSGSRRDDDDQRRRDRSEEHTSELQSRRDLVCRLLLEKKNQKTRSPPEEVPGHPVLSSVAALRREYMPPPSLHLW